MAVLSFPLGYRLPLLYRWPWPIWIEHEHAARFHPDNPISGDRRRFLQLNEAYEVLSDAGRRAEYDAALQAYEAQPLPIFGDTMFVAGLQGETNRRLGVLSLLYQRPTGSRRRS